MNTRDALLSVLAAVLAVAALFVGLYMQARDGNEKQDNTGIVRTQRGITADSSHPELQVTQAASVEECEQITKYPYKAMCVMGFALPQQDPSMCTRLPSEKLTGEERGDLMNAIPSTGFQSVSPRNYCLAQYMEVTRDSNACSFIEGNDALKQYCIEQYGNDT